MNSLSILIFDTKFYMLSIPPIDSQHSDNLITNSINLLSDRRDSTTTNISATAKTPDDSLQISQDSKQALDCIRQHFS